jgi:glycosyltransferase involved in cell wall biosynthesis
MISKRQSINGGMPLHEAMACGIPSVCADYSALSEWPRGGVEYVPVTITPDAVASHVNTVHRTIDIPAAVEVLERLYQDEQARKDLAIRGYRVATQDKYSWNKITNEFYRLFESLRNEIGKEKVN